MDQKSQSSFRSNKSGGSQRSFRPGAPGGSSSNKLIMDDHIPDDGISRREMIMYLACCCCVFLIAFGAVGGAFAIREPPGERLSNFTYSPAPTPNPSTSPTVATASPTVPPPTVTVRLTVDGDTHVQDGDFAGVVFGREDSLLVQNGEEFNSRILLSFDVDTAQFPSDNMFDRTKRATLQLERVVSIADNPATNITVVKLPPTPSPIERVSWNLYRPVDGVKGPVMTIDSPDKTIIHVDITEFFFGTAVARQRSLGQHKDRKMSNLRRTQADTTTQLLLMLEASTPGAGVEFRSKDYQNGNSAPKIMVTFSSTTPTTSAPVEATPNPTKTPTKVPTPAPTKTLSTTSPTVSPTEKATEAPTAKATTAMPTTPNVTKSPTALNGTSDGGGAGRAWLVAGGATPSRRAGCLVQRRPRPTRAAPAQPHTLTSTERWTCG